MRFKFLSFAFMLFLALNSFAQTTWTFNEGQFVFKVLMDNKIDTFKNYKIKRIEIYRVSENKKIQTILPEEFEFEGFLDSTFIIGVEDMNFDGFTDLRILNWTSLNLQSTYNYWFYNPVTNKFEQDSTLDEIRNPYFNQNNKSIHTWWRDAFFNEGHAVYKWENNKLQLFVSEEEIWGINPEEPGLLITKHLVNGVMEETEKEIKESEINFGHREEECYLY